MVGRIRRKVAPLTPRERGVLRWVVRGCSNGEIAARLCVSPHTVKTYLKRIYCKLGVRNRTEAAIRALNGDAARAEKRAR